MWKLAQINNIKELVNCFYFQVMPLVSDYITLHNLWMLLTFVVTLYLMHCSYFRSGKHFISIFISTDTYIQLSKQFKFFIPLTII